jgi:hypothetical protein
MGPWVLITASWYKPTWPFGVEAFDPVANDLTSDAADTMAAARLLPS